ncbi:MAG: YqhA family protein [Chlorobiaceae bacterium]|nr:YqhA family protein [Chlorobiaceae bacterium]
MHKIFSSSRFLVLIAVAGSFIASITLMLYAAIAIIQQVASVIMSGYVSTKAGKLIALDFVQNADIFLISTVLYIMAVGLYELFIDDAIELPGWLVIKTLDDLKEKLIGIVVVGLAVDFLGHAVTWQEETGILYLGAAIGFVIAGLTVFVAFRKKTG